MSAEESSDNEQTVIAAPSKRGIRRGREAVGQNSEGAVIAVQDMAEAKDGTRDVVKDRAKNEAREKERLLVKVFREQKLVEQDGEKDVVKDVAKDEAEGKGRLWVKVLREQKLVEQDMEKDGEKDGAKDKAEYEAEDKERLWVKVLREQKLVVQDVTEDEGLWGKVLKGQKLVVPTQQENKCCARVPRQCITTTPLFPVLILDGNVLDIAMRYREDMLALNNTRNNENFRHAGYRQFVLWQHGRLGRGNRRVVPRPIRF